MKHNVCILYCAALLLGCDSTTAESNNDGTPLPDGGGVQVAPPSGSDATTPPQQVTDSGAPPLGASDAGPTDSGAAGGGDAAISADAGPAAQGKIAGTYQGCTTYTKRMGDKCGSLYCQVTAADIQAETVQGAGPCSGVPADFLCEGSTSAQVGTCSRMVKSDPANLLDTKEMLRAKVEDCVFKVESIRANIPAQCLSCYLDAASCASDNCLTQCLAGDGPECDACRLENECNQPVPACAGLPSPF